MRYLLFALPLLLTACAPEAPSAVEQAAEETQLTTPAGKPLPADQQLTGDAATDEVITEYARLENLYQTDMLQRKDVTYTCGKVIGRVQLYRQDGQPALALNSYNDGPNRTISDRAYFSGGQPVYFTSESVTWELSDKMVTDANGNERPAVRTSTATYRYFLKDGRVFKFLKKKYDHFSELGDNNVDPATVAEESLPTNGDPPSRLQVMNSARLNGSVDCVAFGMPAAE